MREIEFRGYVEDEQQWVYGYLMPDNRIYQIHEPKRGCCGIGTFSVVPESIGQYTGCRDINGIKIFENDIVKEVYGSRFYQVVYSEHGFKLDPVFVDTHFYQTWISPKRLEVIGNSYTKGEEKNEREQETNNVFKRICEYLRRFL
jgi:uncharacterized phage protein (TIGR01671 family)